MISLRARLVGLLATASLLAVLVWSAPSANAATPTIAVVSSGPGTILVTGTGWPYPALVTLNAVVTNGSGTGSVRTAVDGSLKATMVLNGAVDAGAVNVTGTTGTINASGTGRITAAATPAATPAASVKPVGPAGSWKLAFGDEFNGTAIDKTKWATCFHWGCDGANAGEETQKYTAKNVTVSAGAARLTLRKDGSGADPYTSGMLAANVNSKVLYGYMEMRGQIADCDGCWPAFWAVPADLTWPPEFDIMEGLDNDSKTVSSNVHWDAGGHQQSGAKAYSPGVDFAAGMHTYGADWTASSITFYVDGKVVNTYKGVGVPKVPMYVIANLAITGNATTAPVSMNIDYIRVFQRTSTTAAPAPEVQR